LLDFVAHYNAVCQLKEIKSGHRITNDKHTMYFIHLIHLLQRIDR